MYKVVLFSITVKCKWPEIFSSLGIEKSTMVQAIYVEYPRVLFGHPLCWVKDASIIRLWRTNKQC